LVYTVYVHPNKRYNRCSLFLYGVLISCASIFCYSALRFPSVSTGFKGTCTAEGRTDYSNAAPTIKFGSLILGLFNDAFSAAYVMRGQMIG
jgi:hypothetical protein